jgi:2-polyprenyl-6-methoxyphenol hydroxylase-like FAD-dependent oxidoreductase
MSRNRAVVLGGGIAGLVAARVLALEYAEVTVVERDRLPIDAEHRRGVPQGHHVHALLPSGEAGLQELLPGFTEQLVGAGALVGDILGNTRWYLNGARLRPATAGLTALTASRPLLEGAIRARIRALSNVTLLDGYDAVGLDPSADGHGVAGAVVADTHGGTRLLPADLVVDATGQGARTSRWLAELGFPVPAVDRVGIDLRYASRVFDARPDVLGDDLVVVTARYPNQSRSGVLQRLEGNRVLVTLAGVRGEVPPVGLAEFTGYARTLAAPDTYDVVRATRPVGEPARYRVPEYLRYRFERLTDFPVGLLVIGDAVCRFNPVYGQGMSVAVRSALALRDELRHGGVPDTRRYFAAVAAVVDAPWALAVGADLAVLGADGPTLPDSPLRPGYLATLQRAATWDADLSTALIRVMALVDPPAALLQPWIAARVAAADTTAPASAC